VEGLSFGNRSFLITPRQVTKRYQFSTFHVCMYACKAESFSQVKQWHGVPRFFKPSRCTVKFKTARFRTNRLLLFLSICTRRPKVCFDHSFGIHREALIHFFRGPSLKVRFEDRPRHLLPFSSRSLACSPFAHHTKEVFFGRPL
jgi:hypothetical protein